MADGTIRIDTHIDTKKASAQLLSLQNQMIKTANKIGEIKTRMQEIEASGALDTSAKALTEELQRSRQALSELQAEYAQLDASGEGTVADFERIADSADAIRQRIQEINQQQGVQAEYKKLSQNLDTANRHMAVLAKRSKEVKASAGGIGNVFAAAGNKIAALAKSAFIFSVISQIFRQALNAMINGLKDVAAVSGELGSKMNQLSSSVSMLKASLAAAAAPIIEAFLPAIIKLVDWLTEAINTVGRFFAALTGKSSYTKAIRQTKNFAGSISQTSSAIQKSSSSIGGFTKGTNSLGSSVDSAAAGTSSLGDAMTQTAKDAKKARGELAAFDDLDVLNKQEDTPDFSSMFNIPSGGLGGLGGGGGLGGTDSPSYGGGLGDMLPDPGEIKDVQYELEPIGDTLQWLKDLLGGMWDKFKDGFQFSFGDVESRIQNLLGWVDRLKTAVANIFGDPAVQNAGKEFAEKFIFALGAVVGSVASIGMSIATMLLGGLTQFLENNAERIKDFFVGMFNIGSRISEIVANFSGAVAEIFKVFEGENAIKATENLIGIFADAFMGIAQLAGEIAVDILDLLTRPIIENKEAIAQALDDAFGRLAVVLGTVKSIVDQVMDSALKTYREEIRPMLQWIIDIISAFVGKLLEWWNGSISPILDRIAEAFSHIAEWTGLWELLGKALAYVATAAALVGPVLLAIKAAMAVITTVAGAASAAMSAFGAAAAILTGPVGIAIAAITALIAIGVALHKHWDEISAAASKIWVGITDAVSKALEGIKNFFSEAIDNISIALKNFVLFIAQNILIPWVEAWNSIGKAVADVFVGVKTVVKNSINFVIGLINGMLKAINSGINFVIRGLNMLSYTVPDWVPLLGGKTFGFNIPELPLWQVPTLATGGITTGSTLAQIGEAGREAVLPLDQNTGWMEDLADVIGRRDERPALMQLDGRTFARLIMPYLDGENTRIGTTLSMA